MAKHRLLGVTLLFWLLIAILSQKQIGVLNPYFMFIINRSLIFVILATSLNLINGITGQFSLGHMGFAAVGAYASAIITTIWCKMAVTPRPPAWMQALHLPSALTPPWMETLNLPGGAGFYTALIFVVAIVVGGVAAAIVGFLIGFPSLRLKGDYLAIVTLGFGEIIRTILNNIDYVSGPRGLPGIPKFSTFTIVLIFTALIIVLLRNLVVSSHGRAMLSIRENELASELCGIDTTRYKVLGFVFGSFCAGIAGGLLAHLLQIAVPTQYGFLPSAMVLIMVYAGGMGSLTGSILAAFSLTFLEQGLKVLIDNIPTFTLGGTIVKIGTEWTVVIYAVLLILIMLFKTEGIMGMRESKILIIEEKK